MPPAPMISFAASGSPALVATTGLEDAIITDEVVGSAVLTDLVDLMEDLASAGVDRRQIETITLVREILIFVGCKDLCRAGEKRNIQRSDGGGVVTAVVGLSD